MRLLLFFSLLPLLSPGMEFAIQGRFSVTSDADYRSQAQLRVGAYRIVLSRQGCLVEDPAGASHQKDGRLTPGEHELQLRVGAKIAWLALDGQRRILFPPLPSQGRPKVMFSAGNGFRAEEKFRIQKLGKLRFNDDFTRLGGGDSLWETKAGQFVLNSSQNPGSKQSAFTFWGIAPGKQGISLARPSRWFWSNYELGVSGRSSGDSAWGIVYDYRDEKNWRAVLVDCAAGKLRWLNCRQGRETQGICTEQTLQTQQWYRLTLGLVEGRSKAFLNGRLFWEEKDASLLGGRVGLLVLSAENAVEGVCFDDFNLHSLDVMPDDWTPPLAFGPCESRWADFSQKDFSSDAYMTQWAHPRSFWDEHAGGLEWFRTRFYHDVTFSWKKGERQRIFWPLQLNLFSEPENPRSGYQLLLSAEEIVLKREGQQVLKRPGTAKIPEALYCRADADGVRLLLDGTEIFAWRDSSPPTEGRLGVRFGRVNGMSLHRPDWRDTARAESTHRIDYGFDSAPVAWEAVDSVWKATHRWACVPKWSFFGGRGHAAGNGAEHANAVLWNLRRFRGDFDLEIFAAPMEGTPQRVHFAAPANLNVVFNAQNKNFDSGYLLNFGLYDAPTRLFRNGVEMAAWDKRVSPSLRRRPLEFYQRVTRVWQQIRIQRRGKKISVQVAKHSDKAQPLGLEQVFELEDAEPLSGERIGLWAHGSNGLAVARATISFADSPGAVEAKPVNSTKFMPNSPEAYKSVRRQAPGGAKPLYFDSLPADLAENGTLDVRLRMSPGTRQSLFVHLRGQVAEWILNGPNKLRDSTLPLGNLNQKQWDTGKWEDLHLDLGAALRRQFPSGILKPTAICVDNPNESFAEIAGFGQNPVGSLVEISKPKWTATGTDRQLPPAKSVYPRWSTFGGSDGAMVYTNPEKNWVRLFNRRVGGPAGVELHWDGAYRLSDFPRLTFSYRWPESVELNLLVEANGRRFEIMATGTDYSWPVIGRIDGFVADNTWRQAEVDLASLLARHFPQNTPINVERIFWADSLRMSTPRTAYFFRDFRRIAATKEAAKQVADSAESPSKSLPIPAPRVTCVPEDRLCFNDFEYEPEERLAAFAEFRIRRGTWVDLVKDPFGSCVQFSNLGPSAFYSGYFRCSAWDPKRWPRIAFDYKFKKPGCNLNLSLLVNEDMTIVEWTGKNSPGNYFSEAIVGGTTPAIQDGRWHHVEFDLYEMLCQKRFRDNAHRGAVVATELSCWATSTHRRGGLYQNPGDAEVKIDNFTIFSPRGRNPEFRWDMPAESNVAGYAFCLDQSDSTVPDGDVQEKEHRRSYRAKDLAPGTWWFHIRAQMQDGSWSPVVHRKVVVE